MALLNWILALIGRGECRACRRNPEFRVRGVYDEAGGYHPQPAAVDVCRECLGKLNDRGFMVDTDPNFPAPGAQAAALAACPAVYVDVVSGRGAVVRAAA